MSETARNLLIIAAFFLLIHLWIMYDLKKINKRYEHYKKTGVWTPLKKKWWK